MSKELTDHEKNKIKAYRQGQDDEDLEQSTGRRTSSHKDGGGIIFENTVDRAYHRGRDSRK
jgi:hypothetical protein